MIHRTPEPKLEPSDFIRTQEHPEPMTDYDCEVYEEQCNVTVSEERVIQIYHELRKKGIV